MVVELQYFPSITYFSLFIQYENILLEQHENFTKQTYRNRCEILSVNGVDVLTVPVIGGNSKTPIRDVRIDYTQKWVNRHWRAIQSAYGKAPFFEYYAEEFKQVLYQKQTFLFDMNLSLLTVCLRFLQMSAELKFTSDYESFSQNTADDLRSVIHPKKDYPNHIHYLPVQYTQVFGNKFVKNLSILDLLFCEGPGAYQIIKSGINS